MSDLTEFLLARIADDEALARASHPHAKWWVDGPAEKSGMWWVYDAGAKFKRREDAQFVAHHDPARVLAECAAKRHIVEWASDEVEWVVYGDDMLRALAAVYADHPDYRDEWKP
jgi:hypothetical protein